MKMILRFQILLIIITLGGCRNFNNTKREIADTNTPVNIISFDSIANFNGYLLFNESIDDIPEIDRIIVTNELFDSLKNINFEINKVEILRNMNGSYILLNCIDIKGLIFFNQAINLSTKGYYECDSTSNEAFYKNVTKEILDTTRIYEKWSAIKLENVNFNIFLIRVEELIKRRNCIDSSLKKISNLYFKSMISI